jgi:hypothetical protein
MENNMEIKTRTVQGLLPRKERVKDIAHFLQHLTVEDLKKYHKFFSSERISGLDKKALVMVLASAMTFTAEKDFREWFFRFPSLTQKLLYRLAFDSFVPVQKLEEEFGMPLVQKAPGYSWQQKWVFLKETGLDFPIYDQYGQAIAILPFVVRKILTQWLVPLPGLVPDDCVSEGEAAAGPVWDNSAEIADSLPLLYDAIGELLAGVKPPDSPYKCIRGFKKKDADGLRVSSAFKPFTVPDVPGSPDGAGEETGQKKGRKPAGKDAKDLVPDSADLTARFILAMKNFSVVRPADGQREVKALVQAFFSDNSSYKDYINPPDRHSLEYNVLFDHVTKGGDYYLKYEGELPASRAVFRNILMFCAKDGRTFDAGKVARSIYRSLQPFFFYYDSTERHLKYRADEITADGITYVEKYYSEFAIKGVMEYYLLIAPLFKAYCYLFAALGVLEITQAAPPFARTLKGKSRPFSPYDSLKTFRVTEFGRWCLGLTEKRPERAKPEYQAIADKELFLVTVQGSSLERTIYLDKIGRKLGANRWRISPDSFIAGCTEQRHLEERVAKFKALIDPDPAPHWRALFEKILNRAGLFDYPAAGMLMYQLPADRSIAEELLSDPELRSLVYRAEGGFIVVPEKNLKKFQAVLNVHGIVVFDHSW